MRENYDNEAVLMSKFVYWWRIIHKYLNCHEKLFVAFKKLVKLLWKIINGAILSLNLWLLEFFSLEIV